MHLQLPVDPLVLSWAATWHEPETNAAPSLGPQNLSARCPV